MAVKPKPEDFFRELAKRLGAENMRILAEAILASAAAVTSSTSTHEQADDAPPQVMTTDQVAEFLGVSRVAVWQYGRREDDPLPCHRPAGDQGDKRFIRQEVLEWLRRQ